MDNNSVDAEWIVESENQNDDRPPSSDFHSSPSKNMLVSVAYTSPVLTAKILVVVLVKVFDDV